jgi:hypothetical protein
MKGIGITLALVLGLAGPVTAGELLLVNGTRMDADLVDGTVLVSIGTDVVEVNPDTIVLVTPSEVRLNDGRVLAGTLVGGRLRTRTAMGELAVRVEELQSFQAHRVPDAAPAAAPHPAPAPVAPAPAPHPAPAPVAPASAPQPAVTPIRVSTTSGPTAVLARPAPGPRLVVISDHSLLRDALTNAAEIGRVVRGQTVTKVDAIDRRLTIFNRLIFDGGHWIKVRVGDGTEGWIPATSVREVQ